MKKAIYLSTVAILLSFPNIAIAQTPEDLTPGEVFCMNTSANSENAIAAINKMIGSTSNRLSVKEKKILIEMKKVLDRNDTVASVCSPEEF